MADQSGAGLAGLETDAKLWISWCTGGARSTSVNPLCPEAHEGITFPAHSLMEKSDFHLPKQSVRNQMPPLGAVYANYQEQFLAVKESQGMPLVLVQWSRRW